MTQEAGLPTPQGDTSDDHQQLRRWRRWRWLSRFLLGLVMAGSVLFAAGTWFVHQMLVPRIQEYRPRLEQEASVILGVPMRIGAITTLSGGWIPSFELQQVELLGPDGQPALILPRVVAAVSARSLWWLGFEQIYIDAPVLDVRRDAQGRLLVAGLELGKTASKSHEGADWFFSQPEFVLRRGTINWTDDLRQAPSITLQNVDVVVRNPSNQHLIRLDATPPVAWGDRFTLQGQFKHGLLEAHVGNWQKWSGSAYVELPRADVVELRKYGQLGLNFQSGKGALRLWADVHRGEVVALTSDVALEDVHVTLGEGLPALALSTLRGRLGGVLTEDFFEMSTTGLQFTTHDGVVWPGGNVYAALKKGKLGAVESGELRADKLDLATLAQIANRLPLGETAHRWLTQHASKGLIDTVRASWTGPWESPKTWSAKGKVSGIEILGQASSESTSAGVGRPGVRGASAEFDWNQAGGQAKLAVHQGAVTLPGVFEDPLVPVEDFTASVNWSSKGDWPDVDVEVNMDQLRFSNPDMQGLGSLRWHTLTVDKGEVASRYPGVLEMDLSLSRADGTRVFRYLPLGIPKVTRDYVRDAVTQGRADDVKVRVKGDLRHFPFSTGPGEFRIQAQVKDAQYAYVPYKTGKDGSWPALTQLSGQLIFDRASMEIKGATSRLVGTRQLQASKVQASIASLNRPVVIVQGEIKGPLGEMLDVVRSSALNGLLRGVLATSSATGDALTRLRLELPLAKLESSRVEGAVMLAGNDVRVSSDTPALQKAKGVVSFSESGFQVTGAQARFLGGEVKFEGGTVHRATTTQGLSNDQIILLKGQGQASAQGLREARELGLVSQLAKGASGSFAYTANLGFKRGHPEILVQSNLVGLALNLPQPMVKTAEAALPLKYEQVLRKESLSGTQPLQDVVSLDVGQLVNLDIIRDLSGLAPKAVRGTIGVGQAAQQELPMPAEGIAASIVFDQMDLDAWDRVFQGSPAQPTTTTAAPSYWPNAMALRTKVLTLGGRQFKQVLVGGTREGLNWRANVDAEELDGYLEYRQGQGAAPGFLYVRLSRLNLGATVVSELESVLDDQPATVPALDIVVEDFEYKGKKLGRVEIDAINQGRGGTREWRLRKLNVVLPEASLQASGNWTRVGESSGQVATPPGRNRTVARRSAIKFKLDVHDSGVLLQRMGMGELVRKTPGTLEGQISWVGSPLALDYPSLQGQLNVDMKEGQFLKVDPGAARLLGVLSLQSLPRRLALDFRDVFSEGFAFDSIKGDVAIENGIAKTNNLQMKGVVAGVLMEGTANIARETQDLHVVVVPEINAGTASLFAAAVNPIIGLGTFLAQAILRRPLIKNNTEEFKIEGTWSDPKVTKLTHKDAPAAPVPVPAASGAASQ